MSLDISLYNGAPMDGFFDQATDDSIDRTVGVIDLIIPHAAQWHTIRLGLYSACFAREIWAKACGKSQRLTNLEIYSEEPGPIQSTPAASFDLFLSSHCLMHFTAFMDNFSLLFPLLRGDIPWSQLVKVVIAIGRRAHYAHIVQECTALEELELTVFTEEWDDWESELGEEPTNDLQQLSRLHLKSELCSIMCDMLSMTATPHVQHLTMVCPWERENEDFLPLDEEHEKLWHFLQRSGMNVRWIEFEDASRDSEEPLFLLGALQYLPHLRVLSVREVSFTGSLLHSLTAGISEQEVLVPHLKVLRVEHSRRESWIKSFQDGSLLAMVFSRIKHPQLEGKNILEQSLLTQSLEALDFGCVNFSLKNRTSLQLMTLSSSDLELYICNRDDADA